MKKYKCLVFLIVINLVLVSQVSAKETTCNYYTDNEEYKVVCDIKDGDDITCRIYQNSTLAKNASFKPSNWDAKTVGKTYQDGIHNSERLYQAGFRYSGKQLYIMTEYTCPKYAALEYVGNEGYLDFTHNFSMLVTNYNGDLNRYYNQEWYDGQEILKQQNGLWYKVLFASIKSEKVRYETCEQELSKYAKELNQGIEELKANPSLDKLKSLGKISTSGDTKLCGCGLDAENQSVQDYLSARDKLANLEGITIQPIKEVCPRYGETSEEIKNFLEHQQNNGNNYTKPSIVYCNLFGEKTFGYIKLVWNIIKYAAPVLVIILGMLDFAKVVFSGEEKDMKVAGQRFIKRIIAAVVIILLPVLLRFIFSIVGFSEDCLQHLL